MNKMSHAAPTTPRRATTGSTSTTPGRVIGAPTPGSDASAIPRIRVVVRVRPHSVAGAALGREGEGACLQVVPAAGGAAAHRAVQVIDGRFKAPETTRYTFDAVYGPESEQAQLYTREVAAMVSNALRCGLSSCVFAYGPSGTGKTHTMQGTTTAPGIIPRVAQDLLGDAAATSGHMVTVSFLEVYLERVYDLLVPASKELPVREMHEGRVVVADLKEVPVSTPQEFLAVYQQGRKNRKSAATGVNSESSRSHAVLVIKVYKAEEGSQPAELTFIDLAGHEDNRKTGNDRDRMQESAMINQSLFVLGKIIRGVNAGETRLAFRDSKLTRLLQHTLRGASYACMICTVQPGEVAVAQTKHTLEYASKARTMDVTGQSFVDAPDAAPVVAPAEVLSPSSKEAQRFAWLQSSSRPNTPSNVKRPRPAAGMEPTTPSAIRRRMSEVATPTGMQLPPRSPFVPRTPAAPMTPGSKARTFVFEDPVAAPVQPEPAGVEKAMELLKQALSLLPQAAEQQTLAHRVAELETMISAANKPGTAATEQAVAVPAEPVFDKENTGPNTPVAPTTKSAATAASAVKSGMKNVVVEDLLRVLNFGTEEELLELHGIGAKRAAAILAKRDEAGFKFTSLSELHEYRILSMNQVAKLQEQQAIRSLEL